MSTITQIFALHFFNDGFLASIALFLPFISKDLGLSLTQVGFLGSIFSLVGILLALPIGTLSHRVGAMKILVWASLFYSLGFILTGFSTTYLVLVAAFFIASIGFGSFHTPAFAEVATLTPKQKKGRVMGDFTAFGEFGRVCLSAFIPYIIVSIGWRNTSFIYAFGAATIFIFFIFNHLKNGKPKVTVDPQLGNASFLEIIKNPKLVLVLSITFFDLLASSALFVFLPFLLIHKGISPSVLGAFTSAFFIGNLIGKMVLGRLTDLFTNTKVFIAAELLMAIFILLLAYTGSVIGIIVFSIILGSLTMGTVPIRTTMLSDHHNEKHSLSKAFALGSLVSSIATATAPLVLGFIADHFGIVNAFNATVVFALVAIVPAAVLLKQS